MGCLRTLGGLSGLILLSSMSVARAELPESYQVVLMTDNFAPFSMAQDDKNFAKADEITGVNADLVKEIFKRAKIDYNLTLRFPWERIYKNALDTPDSGVFSVAMSDERKPLFKWVGPLYGTERVFVAAPNSSIKITNPKDASKYRVGSYKGGAAGSFLDKNNIPYEAGLQDQDNAKKLIDGKIDLWVTNDPVFRYLASKEGIQGLKVVFVSDVSPHYLALNLKTPDEVVQRLQQALDEIRADGTFKRLGAPYLDKL